MSLFSELLAREPTMSFYQSEAVIYEIMRTGSWRSYSTSSTDDVGELIDRFLRKHAKSMSAFGQPMYSRDPMQVLYWMRNHYAEEYKGALFLNGAVLQSWEDEKVTDWLFLKDAEGIRWGYPDEGYDMPAIKE